MTKKPTYASVTEVPCACDYLQNAASDESNPIRFDERAGEFQFIYGDAMLVIYHCPFCGGGAPPSKREQLFHAISTDERERLTDLVGSLRTIEEAIATLGKPDFESQSVASQVEKDAQPPEVTVTRLIRYYSLSDAAEVNVIERPDGTVYYSFTGKYAGPRAE
jgi:hypothetical protein